MSLRWRIALAMATIAVASTIAIGAVSYRSTRQQLLSEVDRSLSDVERIVRQGEFGRDPLPERGPLSGLDARIIGPSGAVVESTFEVDLPLDPAQLEVIGRRGATTIDTVATDDGDYRVRTIGLPRGAIQVGRSLADVERVLDGLRTRIVLWSIVVGGIAAAIGWWIASAVTASLRRLTAAAEVVEATGRFDVDTGPDDDRRDEAGRLGAAFRAMLAALARSEDEQRRLVQDAGHELRTPLTSLRTNLDVLDRYPDLDDDQRQEIVGDLRAEVAELAELVDEIVAVASGETSDEPAVEVQLDELVAEVVDRYERRSGRAIELERRPSPIIAQRSAVQRAVSCLLDNAVKFDPSGEPIEVEVGDGGIVVRDRGPGFADEDLPHVFERFFRAEADRTRPGSGLGLSIVDAVARRHGGATFARVRPGGGAEVGFRLGTWPPPSGSDSHRPLTSV